MTKQKEIRVGLGNIKLSDISYDGKARHPHFLSPIDIGNILSYLDENGVVIKADRVLSKLETVEIFEAVEPLIKEINNEGKD